MFPNKGKIVINPTRHLSLRPIISWAERCYLPVPSLIFVALVDIVVYLLYDILRYKYSENDAVHNNFTRLAQF